jgi:hypothetical protein
MRVPKERITHILSDPDPDPHQDRNPGPDDPDPNLYVSISTCELQYTYKILKIMTPMTLTRKIKKITTGSAVIKNKNKNLVSKTCKFKAGTGSENGSASKC